MIKSIIGHGSVMASYSGMTPYIPSGAQSAGMVRYNTNMQSMEVYDGSSWQTLSTSIDIQLTQDAETTLAWAKQKMAEEKRIDELCEKYPGLARARENYEVFLRMVAEEGAVP